MLLIEIGRGKRKGTIEEVEVTRRIKKVIGVSSLFRESHRVIQYEDNITETAICMLLNNSATLQLKIQLFRIGQWHCCGE